MIVNINTFSFANVSMKEKESCPFKLIGLGASHGHGRIENAHNLQLTHAIFWIGICTVDSECGPPYITCIFLAIFGERKYQVFNKSTMFIYNT